MAGVADDDNTEVAGEEFKRCFLTFLHKFRDTDGDLYYVNQAKQMRAEKKCTLYVRLSDLGRLNADDVDFDPLDMKDCLREHFFRVRPYLDRAVEAFVRTVCDIREELEGKQFTAAFYDLDEVNSMRDLRTGSLGRLVAINGTVTRTTEIKPELLLGAFECGLCNQVITGVEQQFKFTPPVKCPWHACTNQKDFRLNPARSQFVDWQKLRLQESGTNIPAGSMPRSLDVILRGEAVELCKPGDKVVITGTLLVVPEVTAMMRPGELPKQVRREQNKRFNESLAGGTVEGVTGLKECGVRELGYKTVFLGLFVEPDTSGGTGEGNVFVNIRGDTGDHDDHFHLTRQQKDRLTQIAERSDVFAHLASAIAPSVNGRLDIKKGILTMLVGGVHKKTPEGIKLRGDINMCLVGDPATGKSQFLKYVANFLPRAIYASGKSSSAAGLTACVTRDNEINDMVIEPGALMLADNGICCIDEFDKMDAKDQVALHEAMEQQTISISKAGVQAQMNARTSIIAAAQPKLGRYDPNKPLAQNLDITAPLMSRFDYFFVIMDGQDDQKDTDVARHIVNEHMSVAPEENVTQEELQMYIRTARQYKPRITPNARKQIVFFYKEMRGNETFTNRSSRVTVRQLEALIRVCEAVARIHLSTTVEPKHVKMAIEIVNLTVAGQAQTEMPLDDQEEEEEEEEEKDARKIKAAKARNRHRIGYSDYERIARAATLYLERQEEARLPTTEEDLISWYTAEQMAQKPDMDEEDMLDTQRLITLVVNRLINKDKIILVVNEGDDPVNHPEKREIKKHPNFVPTVRAEGDERTTFQQAIETAGTADEAAIEP